LGLLGNLQGQIWHSLDVQYYQSTELIKKTPIGAMLFYLVQASACAKKEEGFYLPNFFNSIK